MKLTVVGGASSVPVGVSGVVLNVTVTKPSAAGYVTVWADGSNRPVASNLNFAAGQTVPNLVFAPVGADGKIDLYSSASGRIQLIADVFGYFGGGTPTNAGAYAALTPTRLMDTRVHLGASSPGAHGAVSLAVTGGSSPVPVGTTAVVLNVTVTQPKVGGSLTVWPGGTTQPTSSSLNFNPNQTIPNLVVSQVGADGTVDFYNGASSGIQLVVDVAGYFVAGTPSVTGTFHAVKSKRLLDTRSHLGADAPQARGTVKLTVGGVSPIPAGVPAVIMNVAVTGSQLGGYITVFPDGHAMPTASNLNFVAGQTISNAVLTQLGANGVADFYNGSGGISQLTAHVAGYFLP